jgi:uncharacterized protein (DUF885 family)
MKKIIVSIVTISILFIACKQQPKITVKENEAFNQFLEAYYQGGLQLSPISATFAGDNRYNHEFPNTLSEDFQQKTTTFLTNYLTKSADYTDETLTESQQMSKAVLIWDCEIRLEELHFKKGLLMPIDQMWSVHLIMGQLGSGASAQPFKTVTDYTNWLQRLAGYDNWLHTAIERMQQGIKEGYVLPVSLTKKVIPQFEVLATTALKKHLFYSPLNKFPESFSKGDKEKLTKAYTKMLSKKLLPTFNSMYQFLTTDYISSSRASSGISDTPNGLDYYKHSIKNYTTTTMTADEIHNLGLSEVARILSEMEKVKQQVGFKGTLKEFFDDVRKNKKLMPYTTPKQIIDHFNEIHTRMKPQLEKLFGNKPKTAFIVKQTEKFREASASAEYNRGSLDGTRPGVFYTPIPDATKYNVFSDEALFLHEAIPGHHYQISLQQENTSLPSFRKTLWYSAYGEGWALYTENLGKELGLYTDPYQYFGMLGMEMHRAIRLVVDTGLHTKGWSREKAIQYSLDNEAESEAGITSEIERYMANPGQALSYKIGQLKIRELRAKATQELGDTFDIKEFHNQVLESGCIPLALLEAKINKWIAASK